MKLSRGTVAAIAATGALALAVPALAQDDSSTPEPTEQKATRDAAHAERTQAFAQALADELGLPVEDVATALGNVREQFETEAEARRTAMLQERLDAAVADGSLTQQQADAILEAADAGVFPGRKGHRGMRGHQGPRGFGPGRPGGPAAPDAENTAA